MLHPSLSEFERRAQQGTMTPLCLELLADMETPVSAYIKLGGGAGSFLLESVDGLIAISRRSGAPAEIYHLKQAGRANWGKLDQVIAKVEAARASGLRITADRYTRTAGGPGVAGVWWWERRGGPRGGPAGAGPPRRRGRSACRHRSPTRCRTARR